MPKLNTFQISVRTGVRGVDMLPQWVINGFPVDFEDVRGSTKSGDTFEATGSPGSFPHTLLLRGPDEGNWDIEETRITYYPNGEEPYTVRLGAVTLDAESDMNLWYERPQAVLDV
ncbi:MAG: helicase [Candidatus Hydrogenedentes bacterium]|nr:helicase [Candidatus Hydrogenedentota bacterium]